MNVKIQKLFLLSPYIVGSYNYINDLISFYNKVIFLIVIALITSKIVYVFFLYFEIDTYNKQLFWKKTLIF